ncbi:ras-related protein RABA2a-like [Vigna radiata var. radiata]|uniref:Ras-related protein RABA2a-like n=1 Tax=Vigna radiata var. radiata TaxID=3916 RepID=A0A1S3TZQ4_VIGRR|nr:ras-related protein RABA2a-like [Vigna radiata var. radiata]
MKSFYFTYTDDSPFGAITIRDMTRPTTFENVSRWLKELKDHADANIVIMLITNKTDMKHLRVVATEDAQGYPEKEGFSFIETFVLEATNVKKAFQTILSEIYRIISKKSLSSTPHPASSTIKEDKTITVRDSQSTTTTTPCCTSSCICWFRYKFWLVTKFDKVTTLGRNPNSKLTVESDKDEGG